MSQPTTMRWTKLSIWPEDDNSPGNFVSKVCGLTSKGFSIDGQTSDSVVPDCDDPDLPAWIERVTRSLSSTVTGSGIMATETFAFWKDWSLSGDAKNVRVVVDLPSTPGYFAASYLLTKFQLTGNDADGKVNVDLNLESTGAVTYTTGSP